MIPKDLWTENIIDSLKQIASGEFQEKGWVRNEIHDYCTFVETACGFFMDSDIEGFLEHAKEFGLTETQIQKLDMVRKSFEQYTDEHGHYEDPKIIINDPEWLKIRALAKDALKSLGVVHYLDPSKDILKDCLLSHVYGIAKPNASYLQRFQEKSAQQNPFEEEMDAIFRVFKIENILANYKDYEINEDQVVFLRRFYEALKAYRGKIQAAQNYSNILDDPAWHHIQSLAAETIKIFGYKS